MFSSGLPCKAATGTFTYSGTACRSVGIGAKKRFSPQTGAPVAAAINASISPWKLGLGFLSGFCCTFFVRALWRWLKSRSYGASTLPRTTWSRIKDCYPRAGRPSDAQSFLQVFMIAQAEVLDASIPPHFQSPYQGNHFQLRKSKRGSKCDVANHFSPFNFQVPGWYSLHR